MQGVLWDFLMGLAYIFPAYVANATPVVAVKLLGKAHALDLGLSFVDGRRILGDGKTFEGLFSGIIMGTLTGMIMMFFLPTLFRGFYEVLVMSLGALAGDILGAFVKRRIGLKQGAPAPVLDQLSFLVVSLLLVHILYRLPSWLSMHTIALLLGFTFLMHIGTNAFAYMLRLKDTWW